MPLPQLMGAVRGPSHFLTRLRGKTNAVRLFLAFRVFFAVLFSRQAAERVAPALPGETVATPRLEAPKP